MMYPPETGKFGNVVQGSITFFEPYGSYNDALAWVICVEFYRETTPAGSDGCCGYNCRM